ncbi:hypothetical protein NSB26_06915 [Phocaeicola sartorii]|nr:hypothetical protein [Phocaeicola sartorii]
MKMTYVSGAFRAHGMLYPPTTEFGKTAATATTFSTGTTMNRSFRRVVAAPFSMR